MRPFQTLCKLLQRQTYSCLSTRSGIWFCLGGLIVLAISAFQFGELLLEWSMQKYNVAFSASHDNIAGKTFQSRLCLPGPIDVVYTWVNGSDPHLIAELNFVKSELMSQLNITKKVSKSENNHQGKSSGAAKTTSRQRVNSEEKFRWKDEDECPFPNCVPFAAIAISGLPRNISEFELSVQNMFLPGFQLSAFDSSVDASVRVLTFGDNFDFDKVKNHTITFRGKEKRFSRVFLSSTIRIGAKKLDGIGIMNFVSKDISVEMIRNALYKEKVGVVSINIIRNTSVIKFDNLAKSRQFLGAMRGTILINGHRYKVLPATLIWKPLTSMEIQQSIIEEDVASSRFADNEELRYSIRSLEKFAPWIRNIFIVTNGQIPSWLNLDHPRIRIITHMELFSNTSHLPTFSSPAIETHIHKIPGLSKKFIYMNDDVFFGDHVWPDDFYTHSKGQKIYLTWPVPNCNEGCPASWVNDKYCDKPCNVSECDWDGGDCLNAKGKPGFSTSLHMYAASHIANREYCNGGCANSWIGDRYCDVNCNVPNCGYDAGDCGPDKLKKSFAIDAEKIKGTVNIPVGAMAFYVNFTNILNDGILTDGTYTDSDIVRTAIFSKKFKTMAVTVYANFTSTLFFHVSGFRDSNHSLPVSLNFSVTVDTTKEAVATTQGTHTRMSVTSAITKKSFAKPYTLYDAGAKELKPATSLKKSPFDNRTMHEILGWYEATKRELPAELAEQLNRTETELADGDITEKGYNKRKFRILHPFYESRHNHSMESNQEQPRRTKRHLLSHFDFHGSSNIQKQKPVAIEKIDRGQKSKHVEIIDGSIYDANDKPRVTKGIRNGVANLRRWISKYGHWDPIKEAFSTSPHRWERQNMFAEILSEYKHLKRQREYTSERKPTRMLLDTFASSLLHVSRIYNRAFGYEARKVPAHMPHFVDIDVINEMQARFWPHFEETSSHKIRMENDMQFAFSYAYYLMDVRASLNMSMIFDELDTDDTNTLSDRELRTLAAQMYSLPLQPSDVRNLEEILLNCSKGMKADVAAAEFPSLIVTRDLIVNCQPIAKVLMDEKKQKRYKFELVGDEDVTFKMIRNNVSHLIYQLDWIRKNRRKFICLNDNIDHDNPQSKLIRTILRDFLEYLFPEPSQFELPSGYRNRYLKTSELRKWKERANKDQEEIWIFVYVVLILFLLLLLRRQIFRLYRIIIDWFSRQWNSHRSLNFNQKDIVKI